MAVTDSHREGIGRIRRQWIFREAQKQAHHRLHLVFFRAAVTDDRILYFERRVFEDRQLALRRHQQRHAARVPQFQSRLDVDGIEDPLHCHGVGLLPLKNRHQFDINPLQALVERQSAGSADDAEQNRPLVGTV